MRSIVAVIIVAWLAAVPLAAQPPNHLDVVRAVKAQVVAHGIDLDHGPGECGRFEVSRRVAKVLEAEGGGLLVKPSGNNCVIDGIGYAVDVVAYPTGAIVDVLCGGNEGPNTPCWHVLAPVDPARWHAPLETGDVIVVPPPDAPPPPIALPPLPSQPTCDPAKIDEILALARDSQQARRDLKAFFYRYVAPYGTAIVAILTRALR